MSLPGNPDISFRATYDREWKLTGISRYGNGPIIEPQFLIHNDPHELNPLANGRREYRQEQIGNIFVVPGELTIGDEILEAIQMMAVPLYGRPTNLVSQASQVAFEKGMHKGFGGFNGDLFSKKRVHVYFLGEPEPNSRDFVVTHIEDHAIGTSLTVHEKERLEGPRQSYFNRGTKGAIAEYLAGLEAESREPESGELEDIVDIAARRIA